MLTLGRSASVKTDTPLPDGRSRDQRRAAWFAPVHVIDLVVWYAVSALVVFVVPTFARQGVPPWTLPAGDEIQAWYWTLAFVVGASGLTLVRALRGGLSFVGSCALIAGPWGLAFVALMVRSDVPQSRVISLISVAFGAFLLAIPALIPTGARRVAARTTLAAVAVTVVSVGARIAPRPTRVTRMTRVANTALVPLVIHYESGIIPVANVLGGAIARFRSTLLLATGMGSWYEIDWDSTGDRMRVRAIALPAPMTREGLVTASPPIPLLRVTGLVVDTTSDTAIVYVAHEVWRREERCLALQVSALRLHELTASGEVWRPVYVTEPCLATSQVGFDPYESGGRLAILPDGALLLTVGDYGLNVDTSNVLAQQPHVDYGKTLRIERSGKRTLHTMGHRNPSGLATDRDGNHWVAEQGPQGGDEINLLRPGANYGWPLTTYGTDYGSYRWRYNAPVGSHAEFTEPALAFVPSVATSSLISVQGTLFEQWSGDLLAGSLKEQQLLRIRTVGSQVAYVEPIPIARRIRDVAEAADGRIVIWSDVGDLVWLATAPDLLAGEVAFEACARCHGNIDDDEHRPTGPFLAGVVGRAVASNPGFAYSEALKRLGGRWTVERLDAFLKSPSQFAPGTSMQFGGIGDSAQRHAVLQFLRRPWIPNGR